MKSSEWIICGGIVAGWLTFVIWNRQYRSRKAAEANQTEEYRRRKSQAAVLLYPAFGLLIMSLVLFNWQAIPPGNGPVVAVVIVAGVFSVFYGLYKWYCLRRLK